MKLLLRRAAVAAAAALALATAAAAQALRIPKGDAEIDQALANLKLVKTKAKLRTPTRLELPDAERALGHHGVVLAIGVLGVDGRVHKAQISRSSGAPVLDDLVLRALEAAEYEPALDGAGKPIPVLVGRSEELFAYRTARPDGTVDYSCRQFILDTGWWRSGHPDAKWKENELYRQLLGFGILLRGRGEITAEALTGAGKDFAPRWDAALETCRANPDRRFVDVLQPEGRYIEVTARRPPPDQP